MALLIVALALFISMVVCWLVLPASTSTVVAQRQVETVSLSGATAEQLA